jgi:hypothetical protein
MSSLAGNAIAPDKLLFVLSNTGAIRQTLDESPFCFLQLMQDWQPRQTNG